MVLVFLPYLESSEPLVRTTPSTNIIIGGLAKYKNYSVQVQSFTGAGPGPLSQPLTFCHTEEDCEYNCDFVIFYTLI